MVDIYNNNTIVELLRGMSHEMGQVTAGLTKLINN